MSYVIVIYGCKNINIWIVFKKMFFDMTYDCLWFILTSLGMISDGFMFLFGVCLRCIGSSGGVFDVRVGVVL